MIRKTLRNPEGAIALCSFCSRQESKHIPIFTGAAAGICEECVMRAAAALATREREEHGLPERYPMTSWTT